MKTISIQGQKASFHDIAARKFFNNTFAINPCDTFGDAFKSLISGKSDYAVVAVENSLYGTINPVYDLLLQNNVWVCGEVYLRIEHCLISTPDANLETIEEVHSQIMAIGQCEDWLNKRLPDAQHIEQHDTTASVVMVKEWADPKKAAIASEEAAKLHNMQILAKNIEDHHENFTRFFILSQERTENYEANKTSIILRTPADTKPGSLYRALGAFAKRDINLLALHARPIVGRAWHYMFYIDVDRGLADDSCKAALDELQAQNCQIDTLGSYVNGTM